MENNDKLNGTQNRMGSVDAISLILKQAGRTADEVASLATLDDADRSAEKQFSGEPPTITSLFGNANASEFDAGRFNPSAEVAKTMAASVEFLLKRKKSGSLLNHATMLFQDETISGLRPTRCDDRMKPGCLPEGDTLCNETVTIDPQPAAGRRV